MFIEDLESLDPFYRSEEDSDISSYFFLLSDLRVDQKTTNPDEASDTVQSTIIAPELNSLDFHPCLNLLYRSHKELREVLTRISEGGSWCELERVFKLHPTIHLLSSETLRKERSQVRILKAKTRFITILQRLITKRDYCGLEEA